MLCFSPTIKFRIEQNKFISAGRDYNAVYHYNDHFPNINIIMYNVFIYREIEMVKRGLEQIYGTGVY